MSPDERPISLFGKREVWRRVGDELREIAWLASAISALSVASVGLAVLLAGV